MCDVRLTNCEYFYDTLAFSKTLLIIGKKQLGPLIDGL